MNTENRLPRTLIRGESPHSRLLDKLRRRNAFGLASMVLGLTVFLVWVTVTGTTPPRFTRTVEVVGYLILLAHFCSTAVYLAMGYHEYQREIDRLYPPPYEYRKNK